MIIQILVIKEKKVKNMAYTIGGFKNIFYVLFCYILKAQREKIKIYLWQRQYLIQCVIWNLQIVQRTGTVGSEYFPLVMTHEFKSLQRYATESWNQSWFWYIQSFFRLSIVKRNVFSKVYPLFKNDTQKNPNRITPNDNELIDMVQWGFGLKGGKLWGLNPVWISSLLKWL